MEILNFFLKANTFSLGNGTKRPGCENLNGLKNVPPAPSVDVCHWQLWYFERWCSDREPFGYIEP